VEDGSGQPLSGARVTLRAVHRPGAAEEEIAGGDGEARFDGLAPGRYAYRVQARDRPELASDGSVHLADGEWEELTVRLTGATLAIRGRVLDRGGRPIAGIEVSAVRHRFVSAVAEGSSDHGGRGRTWSGPDGAFVVEGLGPGEYELRTTATALYPEVEVVVQAGAVSVDLVLTGGMQIYGTVKSPRGEPLSHVWVGLQDNRNVYTHTDEQGIYQLGLGAVPVPAGSRVRFYLQGYEEELSAMPSPDPEFPLAANLDVVLRSVENAAPVSGTVRTERGDPVASATVTLTGRSGSRYQSVSDPDGTFSISGVKIDEGYYLRVLAPAPFSDYVQRDIRVTEDGAEFEVVLESFPTGRLTGRMVDVEGDAVPGFRLWVLNTAAVRGAVPITSDELGDFELNEAPAGSVSFDTRSSPRFLITGVSLPEGGQADVWLVLDWGSYEMAGKVLGDRGDPVGGARVVLGWSHDEAGTKSTSSREVRTDTEGRFRFAQLGPGGHVLDVSAPGFSRLTESYVVGPHPDELEIRLSPGGQP
jgi:protocatechuate 3,4-dioxygenase beta subunit